MLQIRKPFPDFSGREVKTIVLVSIYGHGWVSIAPYTLLAYVRQFEVAGEFRIVCREFGVEDSTERIVEEIEAENPDVVGFSTYVFTVQRTLEGKTAQLQEALQLDEIPCIYGQIFEDYPEAKYVVVETQRGCPYLCRFCAWSDSKKVRYRDIEAVKRDFTRICERATVRHVYLASTRCSCSNKTSCSTPCARSRIAIRRSSASWRGISGRRAASRRPRSPRRLGPEESSCRARCVTG